MLIAQTDGRNATLRVAPARKSFYDTSFSFKKEVSKKVKLGGDTP